MNFEGWGKSIKTYINRKRGKNAEEDVDDESEFDGDDSDKSPGKVNMNGGSHGTVFGINRKIITAVLVGGFLVIGMATIFNLTDSKAKEQAKPQETQETAANADGVIRNDKNAVTGYDQLLDPKRQQMGKPGSNPNNSGNAEANAQNGQKPGSPQQAQQVRPASPVPAIPAAYSAPLSLPSQGNAQSAVQSAEEREAAQAKKELEDRFKSAIDFALGRNGGNNVQENGTAEAGAGAATQSRAMNGSSADSGLVQVGYLAPSDNVLQAGTVIPAMLFSGINTDTPGQITAEVQADVYDTATGSRLLIPAGSTLVGSYEQGESASTGRVSLVFSTLVMPDGGSYNLGDSLVAMDTGGYNGLRGKVNHHTGSKVGGGVFASALAALGSYASGNVSTQDTYSGGQLAMQGALANLMQTASTLFKKGADKKNTVTIAPGQQFNIFVTKPISFGL